MALNNVRVQLLDTVTGAVLQEVNVLTSADAVSFADGQTFQQKLDAGTLKGAKGDAGAQGVQGIQGEAFSIAKTYASVALMNSGYASDGVGVGKFVLIDTGNINDTDNAKLYVKGASAYSYITDLSGATGIQGAQGVQGIQGVKGDTGATGAQGIQGIAGATGSTGSTGTRGSLWYSGTLITGTVTTGTIFSGSGITSALTGDQYHNITTDNIYECIAGGVASVATWKYVSNIKGATGSTGAQGIQGVTGATGATGVQGIQGLKGDTGDTVKIGTTYATGTTAKLFFKLS